MSHALFAFALLLAQTNTSSSQWPPLKVVDVRWIDTTVSACVDFSKYANGTWLAHDTIPAAYSSSGVTRDMSDRNELVVRSVLEDAAARRGSFPPDSTPRKLPRRAVAASRPIARPVSWVRFTPAAWTRRRSRRLESHRSGHGFEPSI